MSTPMFLFPYAVLTFQLVFVATFPSTSLVLIPKFGASKAFQGILNNDDPKTFFLKRSAVRQAIQIQVDQSTLLSDYDDNDNNNNNGRRGGSGGGGRGDPPQNGNNHKRDDDDDKSGFWFILSSAGIPSSTIDAVDGSAQGKTTRNQTLFQRVKLRVSRTVAELEYFVRHNILRQPTEEERAYQRLRSTVVRYVICNSTLVPNAIVQQCAKRGRLIGSPLLAETVQETARWINQWYQREGYTLSSMTGATLIEEDTGTVELVVEEPKFANPCVAIAYARPIPPGNSNSTINSRSDEMQSTTTPTATNENATTTVSYRVSTTDGRTNPMVIQRALGFIPGAPYRWKEREWREISSSIRTVFSSMFHAEPHRLDDGTVQFRIIAEERNAGNFAYGVTKSLMKVSESSNNPASNLEGELSFDYANVFGGGETVSFSVRRAAKDPEASYRFSYSDEEFCTSTNKKHGWRIEGFNQYVGKGDDLVVKTTTHKSSATNRKSTPKDELTSGDDHIRNPSTEEGIEEAAGVISTSGEPINLDSEVIRKGASLMIQNPLSSFGIQKSITEVSAERLISTSGKSENIISTNLGLGPFVRSLPREGRHSIMFAVGVGSRLGGIVWGEPISISPNSNNVGDMVDRAHPPAASGTTTSLSLPFRVSGSIPFTHASATVREVFPFSTASLVGRSNGSVTKDRSITLALRHTVSACTDTIPTTKAMAHAAAHKVRGYSATSTRGDAPPSNDDTTNRGSFDSSIFHGYQGMLMGTTEVRIPVTLPTNRFTQDASIVIFGDWLFAKELDTYEVGTAPTPLVPFVRPKVTRKSSVGIGLRKTIQGFPLQYDISLTEQGRIGAFLNFGRDFDVY